MRDALIELVLAPALVAAATLAARRWGERVGGLVSAFPAIVGPVLLVAALQHGAAFAARAASGTLLGLVALSAFALAYGRAALHVAWPASLAAGWVAAGATGWAIANVAARPATGMAVAAASLALAHRLLTAGGPPRRARGVRRNEPARRSATEPCEAPPLAAAPAVLEPVAPRWDLPLRMALTATLVVSLTWAAGQLGPEAGGVLAALPVLASVLAAFTHARLGAEPVATLLRGMLAGMAGFVCFCALVATLAEPAGIAAGFTAAALATVAVQAATMRAARRRHETLVDSPSSTYTPIGRAPARRSYAAKPG